MEFAVQIKRNLNSLIEPTVQKHGLDSLDLVLLTLVLALAVRFIWRNFHEFTRKQYWVDIKRCCVQKFLKLPFVASKIHKETEKTRLEFRQSIKDKNPAKLTTDLNEEGIPWEAIDEKLRTLNKPDNELKQNGRLSGMYYASQEDGLETEVSRRSADYLYYNPLHVDKVIGVRQADSELVSFFLRMMKGDENSNGTSTSGGTESILVAMVSYREFAREKRGVTEPELLLPASIHSAFYKACFYFKIKPITVPLDPLTFTVDLKKLKSMITKNTIAVCLSAGNYPHGLVDPIPEVAQIVRPLNIPIHVDGCLGGYAMIFSQELGFDVPKFNFEVPEVCSISIDPHKYGLAPKGISLVLFRSSELKRAGIFVQEDWMGGCYGTPVISGSKPAASMIGAWIASLRLGKAGIRRNALLIHEALLEVVAGLRATPCIKVIGNPQLNTFAFLVESPKFDTFQLAEALNRKNWYAPVIQHPSAVHFAITLCNIKAIRETFVRDVRDILAQLEATPSLFSDSKITQVYCSKLKLPDNCILEKVIKAVVSEFSVA